MYACFHYCSLPNFLPSFPPSLVPSCCDAPRTFLTHFLHPTVGPQSLEEGVEGDGCHPTPRGLIDSPRGRKRFIFPPNSFFQSTLFFFLICVSQCESTKSLNFQLCKREVRGQRSDGRCRAVALKTRKLQMTISISANRKRVLPEKFSRLSLNLPNKRGSERSRGTVR